MMTPNLREYPDEQLLQRVAENDERSDAAFRELYMRYQGSLLTKAVRFLGCENEARDCLQDVFVSVWVKRETLVSANLHNYLHQAVRFRALRRLQKSRTLRELDERVACLADYIPASGQLEIKELRHLLEKRINQLPPDQRRIFRLHRGEELTYAQIAGLLGISVKTVEKKMSLALRYLRGRME
jgi:RNA polymerase sigma-70 factor (ECF subfamily)